MAHRPSDEDTSLARIRRRLENRLANSDGWHNLKKRMSAPPRPRTRGDRPRLALVLSGGGARGAYEAGVMRYIREDLAGDLGGQVRFDIICGTSVGGIHACFFAGTAHIADKQ